MFLNSMRHGAFSGFFLGILVLGAAGLMLSDWGGFFRDGVGSNNVAEVNGKPITAIEFDRSVRRILQSQNIQPSDAYKAGIIDQILQNEIMSRLFAGASRNLGIEVDDKIVSQQIHKLLEPIAGPNGDKKHALNQILQAQGMREQDLVTSVKNDIATNLLRQTIAGEVYVPQDLTNAFYLWNMEERNIRYVLLPDSIAEVKKPSSQELAKFYDEVKDQYTVPETRNVTIGIMDPAVTAGKVDISEEDVRAYYDDNQDEFAVAEKRQIEQAVLDSQVDADKVLNVAKKGKNLEAAVKEITGKTSAYSGANSFEQKGLTEQIAGPVFNAKKGDYVGPVKSAFGWHVIYIKSIDEAGIRPFNEVRNAIREDLVHANSGDAIFAVTNEIEDRLAGGEKLESLKDEYKLELIHLMNIKNGASPEALKSYQADQAKILQAAFSTSQDEASPLSEISKGKMFTAQVNEVTPARAKDLKDVQKEIEKLWLSKETRRKLLIHAMELTSSLDSNKTTLDDIAKDAKTQVKSGQIVRGSAPPSGIEQQDIAQIMKADPEKSLALPSESNVVIVTIEKTALPVKKPSASELSDIQKNLTLDIQDERLISFVNSLQNRNSVHINTDLLDRLYGQSSVE